MLLQVSCSSCGNKQNYDAQIREWQRQMKEDSLSNVDETTHFIENMYYLINADDNSEMLNSQILYFGREKQGIMYVIDSKGAQEPKVVSITYENELDENNTVTFYTEDKSGAYTLYADKWVIPEKNMSVVYPERIHVVAMTTGKTSYGTVIKESQAKELLNSTKETNVNKTLKQDSQDEELERLRRGINNMRSEDVSSPSKQCKSCKGSGTCFYCHGRGIVKEELGDKVQEVPCQACHGTGKCSGCGGTGVAMQ